MNVIYFDCFAGLSAKIALGALLQAGASENYVRQQLSRLNLSGYQFTVDEEYVSPDHVAVPISGTNQGFLAYRVEIDVNVHQPHLSLNKALSLIENSGLSSYTVRTSGNILGRLASARAKMLGTAPADTGFCQLFPVQNILGVVGTVLSVEYLAPDKIIMSPLQLGSGLRQNHHLPWPVPSPLTAELVKGLEVAFGPLEGELVTPTGAAIASELAGKVGPPPAMVPISVGYGVGTAGPGMMRVIVGEIKQEEGTEDCIALLETNIDDMNPEFYPFAMEKLLTQGSLDVFMTPVIMKKGRPGVKLSVLCRPSDVSRLAEALIKETSSLGVRVSYQNRRIALRERIDVATPYGKVGVKVARLEPGGPVVNSKPEFEDCKGAAQTHNIPIQEVYLAALKAADHLYPTRPL